MTHCDGTVQDGLPRRHGERSCLKAMPKLIRYGLFLLLLYSSAAGAAPTGSPDLPSAVTATGWVIPSGQEALVAAMVAPGPDFAAGWSLRNAAIERNTIVCQYAAADAQTATVRLIHPDQASNAVAKSMRFALVADPAGAVLVQALLKQLRQRESEFVWQAPRARPQSSSASKLQDNPSAAAAGPLPRAAELLAQVAEAIESGNRAAAIQRMPSLQALGAGETPEVYAWAAVTLAARQKACNHPDLPATLAQAATLTAALNRNVSTTALLLRLADAQNDAAAVDHAWQSLLQVATAPAACLGAVHFAEDLQLAKRGPAAIERMQAFVDRAPNCLEAALVVARIGRRFALADRALPLLQQVLNRSPLADTPTLARLAVDVAQLHASAGRGPAAMAALAKLQWQPPVDPQLLVDVSRIYLDVPDPDRLVQFRQRSDANPHDVVAAFVAGTELHHHGQWTASNVYLARTAVAMERQPRLHLYMAMNELHLAHQPQAEAGIERAFAISDRDPDVYYCRAHVRVGANNASGAVADLQHYLTMTAGSVETYAPKQARVQGWLVSLLACRGARDVGQCVQTDQWLSQLRQLGPWLAAGVGAITLLVLAWRRRRLS
ncbi:MAG: hypothetical protein EXR77_08755 [Myxococcales bacterium]|nr:hypothetical protein [Myxococcales bacterium]